MSGADAILKIICCQVKNKNLQTDQKPRGQRCLIEICRLHILKTRCEQPLKGNKTRISANLFSFIYIAPNLNNSHFKVVVNMFLETAHIFNDPLLLPAKDFQRSTHLWLWCHFCFSLRYFARTAWMFVCFSFLLNLTFSSTFFFLPLLFVITAITVI